MKKILIICNLLFAICHLTFAQSAFDEANAAYASGQYANAAALYESLLDEQPTATLYYNAGNAYYKLYKQNEAAQWDPAKNEGVLAKSVLNYERALRLDPNYEDAKYNLSVAQTNIKDFVISHDFSLSVWFKTVRDRMSEKGWIIVSVILFLVTLTGILVFLLSRIPWLRKTAFHTAWVALIFCIWSGINAGSIHKKDHLHDEAIITQESKLFSSPDESGVELNTLHGGTKVTIRGERNEYLNVKVGKYEGWILKSSEKTKNLERI